MAIQDEMYKKINQEIDDLIKKGKFNLVGKEEKTKQVAKMLTELSVEKNKAEQLISQYIANIKNLCK